MKNLGRLKFSSGSVLFVSLVHLLVANFFYFRGVYHDVYYWAALVIFIMVPVYLINAVRGTFVMYESVFLIMLGFAINYTAVLFWNPETLATFDSDSLVHVMRLLVVGIILFLTGYYAKLGRISASKLPIRNFTISKEQLLRLPPKFYFIGWSLRFLFQILGIPLFEGWKALSTVMSGSVYAALIIDAYIYFSPAEFNIKSSYRRGILVRLLLVIMVEVIYEIIVTGMRELVLLPFILLFVTYIKARKRIPYIFIVSFIIFTITFAMPFVAAFRSKHWFGSTAEESFRYAFETLSNKEESIKGNEAAIKRVSSSLYLAVVCTEKRNKGLRVKTYSDPADYLLRFVPRFLWPNKPSVDYNAIGKEIGIIGEGDFSTSVGLPLMASIILSSGTTGVIITFFLIGVIVRILWEWLMVRTGESLLAFIVYFNTVYIWMRDEEFYISLHSSLSFIIYIYIFYGFISRNKFFNR